jgi:integrase
MKLSPSAFRTAPVGTLLADAGCPGLRYQRRARGWTAQLRIKLPDRGWQSHGLGYLPDIDDAIEEHAAREVDQFDDGDPQAPRNFSLSLTGPAILDLYLSPVRDKARELRRRLLRGESATGGGLTFSAVAADFLERHVSRLALRTQKEYQRAVDRFLPAWRDRPVAGITRTDLVTELDKYGDKYGPVARNHALAILGSLFTFALKRDAVPVSPALKIDRAPEHPRERWLRDAELARVWTAFERIGYPWGFWGQLLALTGQRREQCALLRWEDIDFNDAVWYARQKGDREVLVPLAPRALELLRSLDPEPTGYVFRSNRGDGPIRAHSYGKQLVDAALTESGPALPHWIFHDLRRTVSTGLARLKVQPHIRELVLGHAVMDRLVKTYDRHDYLDEKRDALEAWEAHLAAVLAGGNVMPVPAARGAA